MSKPKPKCLTNLFESSSDSMVMSEEWTQQYEEWEKLMRECKSSHVQLGEDGCMDCGYGSK